MTDTDWYTTLPDGSHVATLGALRKHAPNAKLRHRDDDEWEPVSDYDGYHPSLPVYVQPPPPPPPDTLTLPSGQLATMYSDGYEVRNDNYNPVIQHLLSDQPALDAWLAEWAAHREAKA